MGSTNWINLAEDRDRWRAVVNAVMNLRATRGEVTGEWRKLRTEELHDLYSSPNIVGMIKSRMRWAGYVARIGEGRDVCRGET